MRSKKLRQIAFVSHRYIGLAVGILLILVGITGSLLVFRNEIEHALHYSLTHVVPQGEQVAIASMYNTVQAEYPDYKMEWIEETPGGSYDFWLSKDDKTTSVFVNPYTGHILGAWVRDDSIMHKIIDLHYKLLAGDIGSYVMAVTAVLLVVLCVTGVILWPGWKKLISGFKIKWNGHPQRVNFDIHKVAGIITAVFIALAAFTGAWWNLNDALHLDAGLYAVTATPKDWQAEPVSTPIANQPPLAPMAVYAQFLAKADEILPGARTTSFGLPTSPTGTYSVWKKLPGEGDYYGNNYIHFDQYSGEVVRRDIYKQQPIANYLLDSFAAVHYGTFGGLFTRILYFCVGLALAVLVVTGFVLWWNKTLGRSLTKRTQPIAASVLPKAPDRDR